MLLPEAEFPQLAARRHLDLIAAVAATRRHQPAPSLRQRVGRAVVRFGRWVEGRYPDLTLEPAPRGLARST